MKKKFTKKYIQSIIRTEDRTQIFRLYVQMFGKDVNGKIDHYRIARFIIDNAPTKRIANIAYDIAFPIRKCRLDMDVQRHRYAEFCEENARHRALQMLRFAMRQPINKFTLIPFLKRKYLRFGTQSQIQHGVCTYTIMPIEGNERFCELICRVGERCFQKLKA